MPAGDTTVVDPGHEAPPQGTTVSFLPVTFNAQTLWQSPCFWMVIGSGLTLLAIYTLGRRKG